MPKNDNASTRPIRVLVADDHTIVRRGICALLATEPGIDVVGQAADGQEAVDRTEALNPDVVLMDLAMPRMDGLAAIRAIVRQHPGARILALTSYGSDDQVGLAIDAGAEGYLLKDSSPRELIQAIRRIYEGAPPHETWLSGGSSVALSGRS